MKKRWFVICALFVFGLSTVAYTQSNPTLTCGDMVTDRFLELDLLHEYTIQVETGTILIVSADPIPVNAPMTIEVEIQNANGGIVAGNDFAPDDRSSVVETNTLLSSGDYRAIITGNTLGDYQLFVSCVTDRGDVISENNLVQSLSCGEQIDNTMIRPDELHRYYLSLEDGTIMDVFLESLYGTFAEMTFELGLYSPTNQELDRVNDDFRDIERSIFEQTITTDGIYRLYVQGYDGTDENYRLSVDCTLPDGNLALSSGENRRVLEPTQLSVPNNGINPSTDTDVEPIDPFPTQALIEGIPNTGQLIDDQAIVGYTFEGTADERIILRYEAVRGESQLDLWLQAPDSEMIFTSSLLLADTLSLELTLPQSGEYTIYLTLTDRPQIADAVFTIEVLREESD